ncbi:MAG: hypothetical protein RL341_1141 [Pseudomonadota bacterium]
MQTPHRCNMLYAISMSFFKQKWLKKRMDIAQSLLKLAKRSNAALLPAFNIAACQIASTPNSSPSPACA